LTNLEKEFYYNLIDSPMSCAVALNPFRMRIKISFYEDDYDFDAAWCSAEV